MAFLYKVPYVAAHPQQHVLLGRFVGQLVEPCFYVSRGYKLPGSFETLGLSYVPSHEYCQVLTAATLPTLESLYYL